MDALVGLWMYMEAAGSPRALLLLLLWLALLAAAALARLCHPQDVRTLPGMKSAPKRLPEPFAARDARSPRLTRCLLLAAAITLIALGVLNGGMRDVLVKAINICTECIGLG